jgi:flagellar basal-body rod protein FlgG
MIRSLYTAATGMEAQRLNIDVVANNLANVNTTGYKRSRADFQDLIYQTISEPGATSAEGMQIPSGIQVGLGVRTIAVQKMFEQGDFSSTGNPLDLVIEGDGFFQVAKPDGETGYTRGGAFKQDSQGRVVTSDGYPLEPSLTIPASTTSVTIGTDGKVTVTQSGNNTPTEIGQITLARFSNPAGLKAMGKNLFTVTESSGEATTANPGADGMGTLGQGFLEMSNVNVVEEMVNMIVSQRAYEINSKAVTASDEMLQTINNLIR